MVKPAPKTRRRKPGQRFGRRHVLTAGLVAGIGVAAGGGAAYFANADALPSDLVIGGIDVGGLTPTAAAEKLDQSWGRYLLAPVRLTYGGGEWAPTAADIGLGADYRAALVGSLTPPRNGGVVSVPIALDETVLRGYLERLDRLVNPQPIDAGLVFDSGRPQVRKARPAIAFDLDGLIGQLRTAVAVQRPVQQVIELSSVLREPEVSDLAVSEVLARARALVSSPINVTSAEVGGGWQISQGELAAALTSWVQEGRLEVGFDPAALPTLDEIGARLARSGAPGDIEIDATTQKVSRFELPTQGRQLNREQLARDLAAAALAGTDRVEAPMRYQQVTWLNPLAEQLGIVARLARGSSQFTGSADYRIHNIDVGSAHVDGTLVMPGETLAFNAALGPITYDRGFIDGLVIIADSTLFAIGGGICQVSTTLFRAAFWAGLPVLERHKHLYRVYYYELGGWPIGFDASIWQPDLDMRFVNDTPGAILITRRYDRVRQTLDFELWGTPDGRIVEMTGAMVSAWTDQPADEWVIRPDLPDGEIDQTEYGARGAYASIDRRVNQGEEEVNDAFHSSFAAWPNRYMIARDVARREHPDEYLAWLQQIKEGDDSSLLHRFERPIGSRPDPDAIPVEVVVDPELLAQIEALEAEIGDLLAQPQNEVGGALAGST